MPQLTHDGNYFLLKLDSLDTKPLATGGFRWSEGSSAWFTSDPKVAVKFRQYADDSSARILDRIFLLDIPWQWALPKIPDGLTPYPYQISSVFFALRINRCYLALDPGLGKTIVAALIMASLRTRCVYICPPFLIRDAEAKFKAWAPQLRVFLNRKGRAFPDDYDVMIIPDSMIAREGMHQDVKQWVEGYPHAALFIDEAHRYSNGEAKRTKALLGFYPRASRPVPGLVDLFYRVKYLSGTPIRNRPMELYPILSKSAPEAIGFKSKFDFGVRYCAGYQTRFGWDFTGVSNLEELVQRVSQKFMLRVSKGDVLDLPPKIEDVFIISEDMPPRLAKLDSQLQSEYGAKDIVEHRIKVKAGEIDEDLHVATYRRYLGLEKVKHTAEYISTLLSQSEDEAIIVYGFHTEVIEQLKEALAEFNPIVITGEVDPDKRLDLVDQFQTKPKHRLILGNYIAMGVGFTITRATRVFFAEFSFVPGENEQAIDRAHRIGQTKTLYIQYAVYYGSLDRDILAAVLEKRKTLNAF